MGKSFLRTAGIAGILAVGILGCSRWSRDHSKVLANAAGEKITEKAFTEALYALAGDEGKARVAELLAKEEGRETRNRILGDMVMQKSIMKFARHEGLDKDARLQFQVEQATARVYMQALMARRAVQVEPTEAQLKAFYDNFVTERKKLGQGEGIPPFEEVKAQLPQAWKQQQQASAAEGLEKELRQRYPATYAEGCKPPVQP
jgi:hypothetical protein